ncbi:unnamed protein product [Adineta ricciae]|uniref:Uncharacterized protein n=1 Tax=Adineta ricciae TaxID=249248 RepID=A0A815QB26_ADIRI|nr:unnamed protein product [Adineta ricciae]CAF1596831.1 unnamed protein product [Adineta ricciae]
MTTTTTFNNDHQMNVPVSILVPIPMIVIQISVPQAQPINHLNTACVHCGRHDQSNSKDEEESQDITDDVIFIEEKQPAVNDDVIFVKEELSDVPELVGNIQQEEFKMDFDVDERNFQDKFAHWPNIYSPISFTESTSGERRDLPFSQAQDMFFDNLLNTCCDDIGQLVEYLKDDMFYM